MKLEGRVAIVTGAASGIGRASAIAFAHEGAKVLVVDRDEGNGQATAAAIGAQGDTALFCKADVSSEAEVKQAVETAIARWGRLDILFNNAGIVLVKSIEEMTGEEWDRVMNVNVKAAFLAVKYAAPHMRRGGRRRHSQYGFDCKLYRPTGHAGLQRLKRGDRTADQIPGA